MPYNPEDYNILVLHKTLWHKQSVYPGQTEGNIEVESIKLAKLGYKTVFSGDNHKAFDVRVGGVDFHNLGAFTRNSVDLVNQQPRFCVSSPISPLNHVTLAKRTCSTSKPQQTTKNIRMPRTSSVQHWLVVSIRATPSRGRCNRWWQCVNAAIWN